MGIGLGYTEFCLIRGYTFGDTLAGNFGVAQLGMPDFGGYAVGYRKVQAFQQLT